MSISEIFDAWISRYQTRKKIRYISGAEWAAFTYHQKTNAIEDWEVFKGLQRMRQNLEKSLAR